MRPASRLARRCIRYTTLAAVLAAALLVGACERPFVDLVAPTVTVESPDLNVVLAEPGLTLRLRASAFRDVARVEVNGEPAEALGNGRFERRLTLAQGLNPLFVATFDAAGLVGEDTLWAVHLPLRMAALSWATLPEGRAGHTATRLPDGSVLVTGGVRALAGPATDTAFRLDEAAQSVSLLPNRLAAARTGHTATALPDGRVILLGGAVRLVPDAAADLVPTAEVYRPATDAFSALPIVDEAGAPADPVLQTDHGTALVRGADGALRLYVYGGLGNATVGSGPPSLGVLPFMRVLRVETDRLVAEGPRQRFRLAPAQGFTLTPLAAEPTGAVLAAGVSGPADLDRPRQPFLFDFRASGFSTRATGPMHTPRVQHAAALLAPGLVLISGGRRDGEFAPLPTDEVFAAQMTVPHDPARFFRLDVPPRQLRWGHTATSLPGGRILVVGGFTGIGDAAPTADLWLR